MSAEQLDKMEGATGKIPLFLDAILDAPGNEFDAAYQQLLGHNLVQEMQVQLNKFSATLLKLNDHSTTWHLNILQSCTLNLPAMLQNPDCYDHRYMYFSEQLGYCVNDLVRDCIAAILRSHDSKIFLDSAWLNICRQTDNPSTQGFLAENILMSHIKANGLMVGENKLTPTLHVVFGKTGIAGLLVETPSCVQYIPNVFNYKAIDLLLRLVPTAKKTGTVKIVPIQVTMQTPTQHKASIAGFFADCTGWQGSASKVEWHFVWITRGKHIPTLQKVKDAKSHVIKHKAKKATKEEGGLPAFTEHFVSFGDVCSSLAFLDK